MLQAFLIEESASLRAALAQIEANQHGIVLTVTGDAMVVGFATDGDIRRHLLKGASLDAPISTCANAEFVFADDATPRELLLKQLDHHIRVIPLLNAKRQLTGIVSRDRLPAQAETAVYARARASAY